MSSFQIRKIEGLKMLYMLYAFKSVINTFIMLHCMDLNKICLNTVFVSLRFLFFLVLLLYISLHLCPLEVVVRDKWIRPVMVISEVETNQYHRVKKTMSSSLLCATEYLHTARSANRLRRSPRGRNLAIYPVL